MRHSTRRQRGAAALIVTLMLFFGMLLATVFVNRNLVFEQRMSANQARSTQAFEAAEAGLEWALAQLNNPHRIGADCRPSGDAGASTFRERYLSYQKPQGSFTPVTWQNAGVATPLQPACVRGASGWSCSCPAQGRPTLAAPSGTDTAPAFSLQLFAGAQAGTIRVVANGCSNLAGACLPGGGGSAGAGARIEVGFGLMPGLRTPPTATLTVRDSVEVGNAALGVRNPDPTTGVTIDAGGHIDAAQARLTAPAGGAVAATLAANDTALAGLTSDALFASYFGIDKTRWRAQTMVQPVTCGTGPNCSSELQSAIAANGAIPLVWVDGDLPLAGPLTLGSTERPIAIIASGAVRLTGNVVIHGLVYGAAASWNATAAHGALLRGALISEAGYDGDGTPDLFYDPEVLAALRGNSGSFTRINGSWHDF